MAKPGDEKKLPREVQRSRLQTHLLAQFALGGRERLLTRLQAAGGKLEQIAPDGMPVLPDQVDVTVCVVQRDHHHGPGMLDHLAGGRAALRAGRSRRRAG